MTRTQTSQVKCEHESLFLFVVDVQFQTSPLWRNRFKRYLWEKFRLPPPKVALIRYVTLRYVTLACSEYCTSVIKLYKQTCALLLTIKQKGTLCFPFFLTLINVYFHIKTFNSEQCNIVQVIRVRDFLSSLCKKSANKKTKKRKKEKVQTVVTEGKDTLQETVRDKPVEVRSGGGDGGGVGGGV